MYSQINSIQASLWIFNLPFCVPTEGYQKDVVVNNVSMSLKNPKNDSGRYHFMTFGGAAGEYLITNLTLSNFHIYKFQNATVTPLFLSMSINDYLTLRDFVVEDMNISRTIISIEKARQVILERITFQGFAGFGNRAISSVGALDMQLRDIRFINYTGSNSLSEPVISMTNAVNSDVSINGLVVQN